MPRFLINLFSDIFSSLDWIFFSMPTLPSKEESVGIAPRSLKRSHRGSRVCWGRSGAVYLSQQTKFRPGSARLQRDLSQWRVLPSWRGYLIFVLHSFAWLMPPWDSLCAAGSVCSESCQGVCGTDPARCCWRGLPQPQQCLSRCQHLLGVVLCGWNPGGPAEPTMAAASLPAGGHRALEPLGAGGQSSPVGERGGAQPAPSGWQLVRVPWRQPWV